MTQRISLFFRKYSNPAMWLSGLLTVAALLFSRMSRDALANGFYLAAFVLTGCPIFFRAVQSLKFRTVGIECLVTLAVIGACWIGEYSEAAIVTFLFQFGAYLEQKTMAKTRSAIRALTELEPTAAWRLTDGEPEQIPADEVEEGDFLLVKTGGQVPVDGRVTGGGGYVDEASITGESQPSRKMAGDTVYAGTILESGMLEMKATRVGEDTTFARIIQLVEQAQDAKSPVERFIDRFARYYTPVVAVMALAALAVTRNLDTAITVLVLACPGALVIGAPIANVAGIGGGAKQGVLLKGGDSVHTFARTDAVLFDKTGTLTEGKPRVTDWKLCCADFPDIYSMVFSAEQASDHPLAKAVTAWAREQGASRTYALETEHCKGMGLVSRLEQHTLLIGSEKLLDTYGVALSEEQRQALLDAHRRCATTVLAAVDGRLCLLLSVSDSLKPEAAQCVRRLKKLGVRRIAMLTGDNPSAAQAAAGQAGITEVHAQCLPQDKAAIVRQMQEEGFTVTFVGDGVNDSPALMTADTGIAMGSGTDVAVESSDVVLIKSELGSLTTALALAKRTRAVMYQNIAIAVGTVIVLLVGLFAGYVHMAVGMLIHELSILAVIFHAMGLIFWKGEKI